MKRVFHHPPAQPDPTGRKYWRSLDELQDTPEFRGFLEREFPAGAAEMEGDEVSRRSFLKLMGGSLALAGFGLTGCRRPEAYLVPYSKSVEWVIPGKTVLYATSMPRRRGGMPLIASTTEGRPIKLEGNPLHPASNGATDPIAQGALLDLYDPDRSRGFVHNGQPSDQAKFADFIKDLRQTMLANGGADTAILVEETFSPTRDRMLGELKKQFPQLGWYLYDPLRHFNEIEATRAAFGDGLRLVPRFDRADVVLSLDSDFLDLDEGGIEATRDFTNRRRVVKATDGMNRLYVVENRYTITGGIADHRLRCQASRVGALAVALAKKIGGGALESLAAAYSGVGTFQGSDEWITQVAKDLVASKGKSLVVVGPRQPAVVHALAYAINGALDNIGQTLLPIAAPERAGGEPLSISKLTEDINAKKINNLFVFGGNPVYNALANLDWPTVQKSVANVVRLGYYEDETSQISQWHVPQAHFLEQWGDIRAADGTYGVIQPMILPLFGGLSDLDLMVMLTGGQPNEKPDLVRETWKGFNKADGASEDLAWNAFLRDGFVPGTAFTDHDGAANFNVGEVNDYVGKSLKDQLPPTATSADDLEVVLTRDYKVDDGRYSNNGWLQEMPHPITKICWDNAILMSPRTARRLGLNKVAFDVYHNGAFVGGDWTEGDMVEVEIPGGRKIKGAVLLSPGAADNSLTIALGYGRTHTGRVGRNTGFNAYPLRTDKTTYFATGAKITPTGETYHLVTTQHHQAMEGRNLVRELPISVYRENAGNDFKEGKSFVQLMGMDAHIPANVSLYRNPPYEAQHQWGMAIDLNTCTGCNACVVACQAENNIPVVGKDQVERGRAMHWIRIDRYYSTIEGVATPEEPGVSSKDPAKQQNDPNEGRNETDPAFDPTLDDDPQILTQPVTCHHCENAPCETVCPVNATIHTEEGLNSMAYNRCIGTRYCSNNCPYKVRRFNFFNYNERSIEPIESGPWKGKSRAYLGPFGAKGMPDIKQLSKNPNVTVRMRGVMEKCTFCVQRIEEAKIDQLQVARDSDRTLVPRDSFTTACAQVCPAGAIVFGNVKDPESKVSKVKQQDRDYKMLEYLNVRPRVSYQARLRNPNPAMPGAQLVGETLLGNPANAPRKNIQEEQQHEERGGGISHEAKEGAHDAR